MCFYWFGRMWGEAMVEGKGGEVEWLGWSGDLNMGEEMGRG